MYRRSQIAALLAASCAASAGAPAPANRILGVAEAGKPFLVGSVETKPEAGPVPLVDGDQVRSLENAVSLRLEGENRAVLTGNSAVGLRRYGTNGVYFYLTRGSLRFEARKQPLAICAQDRLYVPSIAGVGQVALENNQVQVRMTTGKMARSGSDPCAEKTLPDVLLTGASGAGATSTAGAATATATAASAGATTSAATVGAVAIAASATAGLASTLALAASSPSAESPINPVQ